MEERTKKHIKAAALVFASVVPLFVGVWFGKGDVPAYTMFIYSVFALFGAGFFFYKASQIKFEEKPMPSFETEQVTGTYNDDKQTKDQIFQRLLEFYKRHDAYSGESIMQNDGPQLEAAELLADIADDLYQFNIKYKDNQ